MCTPAPARDQKAAGQDWSATQYLKFDEERTRAVRDLVARVRPLMPTGSASTDPGPRIFDLGCGPGNSTAVLAEAWQRGRITGIDSSPDMLAKARARFAARGGGGANGSVDFRAGDISTFELPTLPSPQQEDTPHLIFSNAVFHWLRSPARIQTLSRIFSSLAPGAVLAIQVPDNYNAPSHTLMRDTASLPSQPWTKHFADTRIGHVTDKTRPDLDPIEPPETWYNALAPLAVPGSVDVWRTEYMHVLSHAGAIVEWVKGTGLQPYLHRIEHGEGDGGEAGKEEVKRQFLSEYERRLGEAYGELEGGRVMLGYRRLFVVAVRGVEGCGA